MYGFNFGSGYVRIRWNMWHWLEFSLSTALLSSQNHSTSAPYPSLIESETLRTSKTRSYVYSDNGTVLDRKLFDFYFNFQICSNEVMVSWSFDGVHLAGKKPKCWEWSLSQDHVFYQKFQIEFSVIETGF